jgi:hypothetical protein
MSDMSRCTPEEWAAFWKIGQLMGIASPEFAGRVNLAREVGLLDALLQGDLETAERLASEAIAILSGQIHSEHPLVRTHIPMSLAQSGQPVAGEPHGQACMDQSPSSSLPGLVGTSRLANGGAEVTSLPQTPTPTAEGRR